VKLLWAAAGASLLALALFSACEAALTSMGRIRLRQWVGRQITGVPGKELLERPHRLGTMVFVGSNLAIVCLAVAATSLLAGAFGFVAGAPLLGTLAAVAVVAPPAVLIGDVLPRTVVREHPGRLLPALFASGRVLAFLFWPYTVLMKGVAALLFRLLGIPPRPEERSFTRGSIEALLREGEREGVVDRHEREIIGGIFAFGETPVRDVMTPRTDVVAIRLGASRAATARLIWETGFSRFPVTDGSPDNIVGIVHAVDVLKAREGERLRVRQTLFVPETTTCDQLLYDMRRQRVQLAVVLDEYGGSAGIVTMEDLVEELVGDILDEHDRETPAVVVERDRSLVVGGRSTLAEVAQRLPLDLPAEEGDVTVAAYLLRRLGRVPPPGERVDLQNLTFEVLEATPKRIVRVRVRERPEGALEAARRVAGARVAGGQEEDRQAGGTHQPGRGQRG